MLFSSLEKRAKAPPDPTMLLKLKILYNRKVTAKKNTSLKFAFVRKQKYDFGIILQTSKQNSR